MKKKRLTALALSAVMVFSMAGCGSSDKKDSDKKKDSVKAETLFDAIKLAPEYNHGTYSFSIDADLDIDEIKAEVIMESTGEVDGRNVAPDFAVTIKQGKASAKVELEDAVTVTDDRLYLDFDRVIYLLSGVTTEFGSYGLLLPELDDDDISGYNQKLFDAYADFIETLTDGIEIEGKDGEFTCTIEDREDIKKVYANFVDYIKDEDNRDKVNDLINSAVTMVDYNAYAEALYDDMSPDVISAINAMKGDGYVTEADAEAFKEEMLAYVSEETEQIEEIDIFKDSDIEGLVEQFDELTEEDWDELFEQFETIKLDINVAATEDSYKMDVVFLLEGQGHTARFTVNYEFDVDEDVKVNAPDNASTLTEMAEYLMKDPNILEDIANGLENGPMGTLINTIKTTR